MSSLNAWGGMDPNSAGQLWSRWTFTIFDVGKHPPLKDVEYNALRWLRKGFGSVGHANVIEKIKSWEIVAEVEGAPAHDPIYQKAIRQQFQKTFVEKGWGPLAVGIVEVNILAGNVQEGTPRSQLVVMPMIGSKPSKGWTRQPSVALCVEQCGAKCCKGPGLLTLTDEEATRLKRMHREFKPEAARGKWVMSWAEDEQCVFLGANDACTIYEDRPSACRAFPTKPHPGCLVWDV